MRRQSRLWRRVRTKHRMLPPLRRRRRARQKSRGRRRRGMPSLRRVAGGAGGSPPRAAAIGTADAARRGRARGRLALELGKAEPSTTSSRSSSICSPIRISSACRVSSSSSSSRLLKRFFLSPLFESVAFSHSRLARDEEKGSHRFPSLLCSCLCRGQRRQQQRQSLFGRDARDAKAGVSLPSFSLKCLLTDPSYVFSPIVAIGTSNKRTGGLQSYNSSSRLVSKSRAPKAKRPTSPSAVGHRCDELRTSNRKR